MKNYQLGLYEKSMPSYLAWKEKLAFAKEAGFDFIEISIDETDEKLKRLDTTKEERFQIKQDMLESGLNIYTMCFSGQRKYPLGSKNAETRKYSLELLEKTIDFAADLGIRIIQLAGYDVYYEEGDEYTKELFSENLRKGCKMAAKMGVLLAFETMETSFMDTVKKSMYYVKQMNSPYLQLYPDIGNLTNASKLYGTSVNEDLLTGSGHIVAAHLKETIPGHYREIPFGTGHTDYISQLKVLKELGVEMFVGEFWYTGSKSWEDDLKYANDFLRKKLDRVFK